MHSYAGAWIHPVITSTSALGHLLGAQFESQIQRCRLMLRCYPYFVRDPEFFKGTAVGPARQCQAQLFLECIGCQCRATFVLANQNIRFLTSSRCIPIWRMPPHRTRARDTALACTSYEVTRTSTSPYLLISASAWKFAYVAK